MIRVSPGTTKASDDRGRYSGTVAASFVAGSPTGSLGPGCSWRRRASGQRSGPSDSRSSSRLAGAIGLRWVHLFWRLASGGGDVTGVPRTVVDTLAAAVAVALLLAFAAVIEATVTLALARVLG